MTSLVANPEGYMKNGKGALIPVEQVKQIDLARDEMVKDLMKEARDLHEKMKAVKAKLFGDVEAFVELSAEEYGVKLGGKKGNVSLRTYDASLKIEHSVQDNFVFDERIHAAKELIDECLHEWTKESRSEIRTLIEQAFNVDKQGNLSTARVLGLRRVDIEDKRWKKAMNIISDSLEAINSKPYLRFYERDDNGKYQQIGLDFSGV